MKPLATMRKCLVTGAIVSKRDLIRFVIDPERNLIADIDENLPGRGYWVKADRQTIVRAIQKKIFVKNIKEKIMIDKNLLWRIESLVKNKLLQQISLSRKAGQVVFGFDKIKSSLLTKSISLLIQATDGSEREKRRILTKSIPNVIDNCLTGSELGEVFGRERVVHCALLGSDFIEKIIFNANRLNNLKNPVPQYYTIGEAIKTENKCQ